MSACAFDAYDAASQKSIPGRDILRYLASYGLGRAVIQWFRTDKVLFPGTGVDVSLVISVILFVLCTVVVAVKRVMSRKRAKVRMRRIEKDQQAEKEAEQQRENAAENLETETVQGEKNGSERDTAERGSSSESVTFAAAAGGTEEAGQPDQEQERSSEESGGQPKKLTVFWNYITETEIKQIQMLLSDGSEA